MKKLSFTLALVGGLLTSVTPVSALTDSGQSSISSNQIINIIIYIVGLLALSVIVFGIVKLVKGSDDLNLAGRAKTVVIYGLSGLVVSLLAFTINNCLINMSCSSNGRTESNQTSDGLFEGDSDVDAAGNRRNGSEPNTTTTTSNDGNTSSDPSTGDADTTTSNDGNSGSGSGGLQLPPSGGGSGSGSTEPTPPQPDVPNPRYDI